MRTGTTYHEKGVDVKIATDLLVGAYEDLYNRAYLVSSDTDLRPAIRKARSKGKQIEYVGFVHQPSQALLRDCSSFRLLKPGDFQPFIHNP